MGHNAITKAVKQILEYLRVREPVRVRLNSSLREGEMVKTVDLVVSEEKIIKAEATTYFNRALRFTLVYDDEASCQRAWQLLRAFASASERSGGGYFNFNSDNSLRKPKRKQFRNNWDDLDIANLISKMRARTDTTRIVSRILLNEILLEIPELSTLSLDQRQRFKQHLVRLSLIDEISHGKHIAGYRLREDGKQMMHPKSRLFSLEDARIETLLNIFGQSDFGNYLVVAKKTTPTEKIRTNTLVKLSKLYLKVPADLTGAGWYSSVLIRALIETGYFERATASAGSLQFSPSAYDLIEAERIKAY